MDTLWYERTIPVHVKLNTGTMEHTSENSPHKISLCLIPGPIKINLS